MSKPPPPPPKKKKKKKSLFPLLSPQNKLEYFPMVALLDQEGEAALEPGVVASQLHLVHVAAGPDTPRRGGQPLPLAVRIQVDPSDIQMMDYIGDIIAHWIKIKFMKYWNVVLCLTCTTPSNCQPGIAGPPCPPPPCSDWRWSWQTPRRSSAGRNTQTRRTGSYRGKILKIWL